MTHQVKSGPQGLVERIEDVLPTEFGAARTYETSSGEIVAIQSLIRGFPADAVSLITLYEALLRDCKAALSAPIAQAQGDEALIAWIEEASFPGRLGWPVVDVGRLRAYLASRPSAPVAQEDDQHEWNHGAGEGDTCVKCGDKDWMADPTCPGRAPAPQAGIIESHKELMRFYNVDSLEALVDAQHGHIEKLQTQRRPDSTPAVSRPREG